MQRLLKLDRQNSKNEMKKKPEQKIVNWHKTKSTLEKKWMRNTHTWRQLSQSNQEVFKLKNSQSMIKNYKVKLFKNNFLIPF